MALQAITDFSPGIREVIAPGYPPGTLQSSGTFRCYALESGGLAPLPRRINNFFLVSPEDDQEPLNPNYDDLVSPEIWITGITCRNPIFYPSDNTVGIDQNNTDVLLGIEYWYDAGTEDPGESTHVHSLLRLLRYQSIPYWREVWDNDGAIEGTYVATDRPHRMTFAHGRSNSADPTVGGPVVVAFCVDGYVRMFPDDTSLTTDTTAALPNDDARPLVLPDTVVSHQGRAVIHPLLLTDAGFEAVYTTNEAFYFTLPNDWTTHDTGINGSPFSLQVGWEDPTGYQVIASLSASELVMIKSRGGAIVMRGDLGGSDLQAVRFPYVRSPGLSMCMGSMSPLGFLYPVDGSGIWAWAGGETSTDLTPSMLPDFWRPEPLHVDGETATEWGHGYTQSDYWRDWVVLPNNFIYDTTTESLWRFEDPEAFRFHKMAVDWRGRFMYATPLGVRNITDPAVVEYDAFYGATSFQARTQPLSSTLDQQEQVEQVGIIASGKGRVTLTIRTRQNPAGEVRVFEVGADGVEGRLPERQMQGCWIAGSHIEFTINAATHDATVNDENSAPIVHAVLWDSNPIEHEGPAA